MWCFDQGYRKPEDREGMTNWMLEPDDQQHPDDLVEKAQLLRMADEVLVALATDAPTVATAEGKTYP